MEERRLRLQEEANRYISAVYLEFLSKPECGLISFFLFFFLANETCGNTFDFSSFVFSYTSSNSRFVASENKLDSEEFSQNRRFAASGAMTAEEQEQRVLYANVLEYEQDHVSAWKDATEFHFILRRCCLILRRNFLKANTEIFLPRQEWPKLWKANLKKNPNDATLVSGLVSYLLR